MKASLKEIVGAYDPEAPLAKASTIPAPWYVAPQILDLELRTVFARSWQVVGRLDQVREPGQYISGELAEQPIVVVRGSDGALRGFFNVCRHHAAAVVTEPQGSAQHLRCPYHGWTYSLEGELKGTPDFAGVCDFDRDSHGLVRLDSGGWEKWIFIKLQPDRLSLETFLGGDLLGQFDRLDLQRFVWAERRRYALECNWKVFVDNYLDGGYHVPHLHKGLDSVLDYGKYTIETGARFCLQSSPMASDKPRSDASTVDSRTAAVRTGERALYYWIYPNFMINAYGDAMDTNLVIPRGVDRTEVVFDFYFSDVSEAARKHNLASIRISEQIQDEDVSICTSVQRGLRSQAYTAGRLSVRREAGEHLFHRLLHADLTAGLTESKGEWGRQGE